MTFGQYLTQLRETSGLSKTELADKLDVWISYIANIEKGRAVPPPTNRLEQISDALRISPAQKEKLFDLAYSERNVKELTAFKKSGVKDSASEVAYDSNLAKIPVLGQCPASAKNWTNDEVECFESISKTLIGDRRMYILRIHGDSMDRAGIDDGCLVLVDADRKPLNGNIVVARIDHECTIKRLYKSENTITLSPDSNNPKHSPMTFTKENLVQIRGVVDSIYLKKVK